MTLIITKYFIEKSHSDMENHARTWEENRNRMVFLQKGLNKSQQLTNLTTQITDDTDILAVRFPLERQVNNNEYLRNIRFGNGIPHNGTLWLPKEIWIYSMMS